MQKKVKESVVSMDVDTFNKVRGKLKPTDKVELTDKKPQMDVASSSTNTSVTEDGEKQKEVIEPKDKQTIKYLSNIKDSKTGQVSKPFVIADKRYQMVRGVTPSKEVVMAVYCHDDLDENGENIIHPVEHFEEAIAKPFLQNSSKKDAAPSDNIGAGNKELMPAIAEDGYDYAGEERAYHDKESFMDYLNLAGLEGYKHFFVNTKTGKITSKFKTTKEMINSRVELGPDETYMDAKQLKRHRFGEHFKQDMNEDVPVSPEDADTNIPKLKSDIKKLTDAIKNKFSVYLAKLDKPIEIAAFITSMASELGVTLDKLKSIISGYSDVTKDVATPTAAPTQAPAPVKESRVITKKELIDSLLIKKIIKTVKVKDIK